MSELLQEFNGLDGTAIKFGNKELILPPLPVTKLVKLGVYKLQSEIEKAQKDGNMESIGNVAESLLDIAFAALQRNYPKVTKEESVDLLLMGQLFQKVVPALIDTQEGHEETKNSQPPEM